MIELLEVEFDLLGAIDPSNLQEVVSIPDLRTTSPLATLFSFHLSKVYNDQRVHGQIIQSRSRCRRKEALRWSAFIGSF